MFRLAFVDSMNKMEVDFNVSKTAVERMRKEMFHLTQKLHDDTLNIVEQRLGTCAKLQVLFIIIE